MSTTRSKHKDAKTSTFNGVSFCHSTNPNYPNQWQSKVIIKGHRFLSYHATERLAAIASDKIYIQYGFDNKVNILKKESMKTSTRKLMELDRLHEWGDMPLPEPGGGGKWSNIAFAIIIGILVSIIIISLSSCNKTNNVLPGNPSSANVKVVLTVKYGIPDSVQFAGPSGNFTFKTITQSYSFNASNSPVQLQAQELCMIPTNDSIQMQVYENGVLKATQKGLGSVTYLLTL